MDRVLLNWTFSPPSLLRARASNRFASRFGLSRLGPSLSLAAIKPEASARTRARRDGAAKEVGGGRRFSELQSDGLVPQEAKSDEVLVLQLPY